MSYQKRPRPNQSPRPRFRLRKWMIIVIVLVVVAASVSAWAATKDIVAGKPAGTSTADPNSKGEPAKNGDTSNTDTGQNSDGNTKTPDGNTPDTNTTLAAPYGNFVSNHKPNLDSSPAPNNEQSICNTTAGASCQIIFTKGNVTKMLSAQTADSGGAAYWDWNLQQVGLTEGTWKVTAKATLGSQTKTADDVIPFEVGP